MATPLNKNSQYVQSLVDYILDTKPYHSKLTEIVEEYRFFDEMHVHFEERTFVRSKINPTWLYNFFSSGDPTLNSMTLKQLNSALGKVFPSNGNIGAEKAFRDENLDLANVPFVFSKKSFNGPGVADVLVERDGVRARTEPMVEGHDFFQSHGSFQFRVLQTTDANTNFVPSWAETRDLNLIPTVSLLTRRLENDNTRPGSALNQILALLQLIGTLTLTPTAQAILDALIADLSVPQDYASLRTSAIADGVSTAVDFDGYALIVHLQERMSVLSPGTITLMNDLLTLIGSVILTDDYEPLLNQLIADGADSTLIGFDGWIGNDGDPNVGPIPPRSLYVDERLSALSPSQYFNLFSDTELRESGQASYASVGSPWVVITSISTTPSTPEGDTWQLIAQSDLVPVYGVFSGISGYIGSFRSDLDTVFTSSTISFTITHVSQPSTGDVVRIPNRNRIVFGPTAPLETWDIIKVNPLAYTRPALTSTRYGYIQDLSAQIGTITLLFPNANLLTTGTLVLTCRADGITFDLTSTNDPWYTGVAQVGVQYNDGYIGFTIMPGSVVGFAENDRFYIPIVNDPAFPEDFDLGYGYDLDSYDNQDLAYDISQPPSTRVNFAFGTRFTDYDLSQLGLTIDQTAVNQREWRLRAIPDTGLPIATLKKDGSGPTEAIDLQDATTGVPPDPALNAAPVFETIGQVTNSIPDLLLYYAHSFELEWSDDGFNTVTSEGIVPVGIPFSGFGLSFTIQPGSRPFVAVIADNDPGIPVQVRGGDIISFKVQNNDTTLSELPIGLSSPNVARLVMHGDGFHEAPPAEWTVTFSSPTQYTVSGLLTEGSPGVQVPGGPIVGTLTTPGVLATEGHSFNALGIHFTVVPGSAGLDAPDSFTFRTFSRKPSYLVHGSVSGWFPEAVVGESYWNGIIGFEIQAPKASLFDLSIPEGFIAPTSSNLWTLGAGTLELKRLRFDSPNLRYRLIPTPIGSGSPTGWMVSRADVGGVGHLDASGSFTDTYVTIEASGVLPANIIELHLVITADDFDLAVAQDTVILRPATPERLPTANDFVLIDKRTTDRLGLSLNYDALAVKPDLAPLAPFTIDVSAGAPVIIDTYTGPSGIPLSNTSPETAILRDWIPLSVVPYDSNTSTAEFSDAGVSHIVTAAGSGEIIGTISPTGSDTNFPIQFTFDSTFFNTYLPLNAEANVVTYGSGFNEILHARITESVKFLVSGGALTTDFLFNENINIDVTEQHSWLITSNQTDGITATIQDGPFGGFLAGYDNLPYDLSPGEDENGDGETVFNAYPYGYDTGIPLTSHFHEARELAGLDPLTPFQAAQTPEWRAARLVAVLGMIDFYLENSDLAGTTLEQFLTNVSAAGPQILGTTGFGFPAVGSGILTTIGAAGANANNPGTEGASTAIQDAMVVMAIDTENTLNQFGFDVGGLDAQAERTALIYSGSLPPVPPTVSITTYEEFETPLAVVGDPDSPADFTARVFEIAFRVTAANLATVLAMPTPKVFIWLPTWPAPQEVAVVDKVGTGRYRVSIPQASEAKLYLEPGM